MALSPSMVSGYARFAGSLPVAAASQTLMESAETPVSRRVREHQKAMDRADLLRLRRKRKVERGAGRAHGGRPALGWCFVW